MKQLILIITFLLSALGFSQEIVVSGHVVDYEQKSISRANVKYGEGSTDITQTNMFGEFNVKVDVEKVGKIKVTHAGHQAKTIYLTKKLLRKVENDTLKITIELNDLELKEVVVGVKKPEVVIGTQAYSIEDFELLPNKNYLLLTYNKTLKKGSHIRLLDENKKELDSYTIMEESIKFTTDYRNNVHLITTENVFLILTDNNRISILKEDKAYFYKYVAPIVDTLEDRFYYSNFSEIYPAFDYIEFNKTDSVYTTMLKVIDEPMMEQYRAEFKFTDVRTKLWAHNKQIETGIDKEIWVGAAVFTKSVYYTPLYAPLFVSHDSVFVFDHYKDKMYKYIATNGVVDSVEIDYHINAKKTGWEQPLIQDKLTEVIYTLYERNGYTFLSVIDSNSGKVVKSQKLYYRYIEKIQIIDGKIYYIYRPYESIQKKYLYSEKVTIS